jgi:hypothetical protein
VNGSGPDHDRIVRYLLGTLPEDEQARLEEEYFRDDAAFDEVLALEDDLLHEYAQGGLTPSERQGLEQRLLRTPEGRERLERARALLAALAEGRTREARPARWLPAAAAAVVAAGGTIAWVALRSSGEGPRQAEVSPSPIIRPTPRPADSNPPLATMVALALSPGLSRAEAAPRRVTLPDSATLRLSLSLPPGTAGASRAVIRDVDGREVWSGSVARDASAAIVEVPARALAEGDYELVLSGDAGREIASYAFGVLR